MLELDLVVFDLAGTTIQAADQVPAAFREAVAQLDVELSDEEIQSIRGKSKREAIAELLSCHLGAVAGQRHAAAIHCEFQRILEQRYQDQGAAPVAGAGETFDWLQRHAVKVALSTGFDRRLAEQLIAGVGWQETVDAVVCNDEVPHGRPAPYLIFRALELTGCQSVHRVAAVGDTEADLRAAHNAGVKWSIGVLSGAHTQRRLEACPHSVIIPSVKQLPAVFE